MMDLLMLDSPIASSLSSNELPSVTKGIPHSPANNLETRRKLRLLLNSFYWKEGLSGNWLCHLLNISPRIQTGVDCGLVALQMAAEYLGCVQQQSCSLLDMAKSKGFTLEGEMFSALDLASLAKCFYNLPVEVVKQFTSRLVVKQLAAGFPIVFPYDADKNYAPCALSGKRAHWAVIRGFVLGIKTNEMALLSSPDDEDERILHTSTAALSQNFAEDLEFDEKELFLICQHGKMKTVQLWSFAEILKSNANLTLPDEAKKSNGRWKIPDSLSELKDHFILLFPPGS